jgi:hypothetical protein
MEDELDDDLGGFFEDDLLHDEDPSPYYDPLMKSGVSLTIAQVRSRFDEIYDEEGRRYETSRRERDAVLPIREKDLWFTDMTQREAEIHQEIAERTEFSASEREALKKYEREQQSWNPLQRAAAKRKEEALRKRQQQYHDGALHLALKHFDKHEVPLFLGRSVRESNRYEHYEMHMLDLEDAMEKARYVRRQGLPELERDLNIIERSGIQCVHGVDATSNFDGLSLAISYCFMGIPAEKRLEIERAMDRESKHQNRARSTQERDFN